MTAFVVVTGLEPLEVETQMGDFLYAGPPEALKAQQAKSDKFVVYAMCGMGGLFGFFGLVTIVGGLFGKKQQQ